MNNYYVPLQEKSTEDSLKFVFTENPIHRDKAFGIPCVEPSTWKGVLRNAFRTLSSGGYDNKIDKKLFGNDRKEDGDFYQAGMYVYPTFFHKTDSNSIDLEIINPIDRKLRKAKDKVGPIYVESVPGGAEGDFNLLYFPRIKNKENDEEEETSEERKKEIHNDLLIVSKTIENAFLTLGIGAKTTNGYGLIEDQLVEDGEVKINISNIDNKSKEKQQKISKEYQQFMEDIDGEYKPLEWLMNEDGLISKNKYIKLKIANINLQDQQFTNKKYQEFACWYKDEYSKKSDSGGGFRFDTITQLVQECNNECIKREGGR